MDGANNSLTETNEITEEQAMKALAFRQGIWRLQDD